VEASKRWYPPSMRNTVTPVLHMSTAGRVLAAVAANPQGHVNNKPRLHSKSTRSRSAVIHNPYALNPKPQTLNPKP